MVCRILIVSVLLFLHSNVVTMEKYKINNLEISNCYLSYNATTGMHYDDIKVSFIKCRNPENREVKKISLEKKWNELHKELLTINKQVSIIEPTKIDVNILAAMRLVINSELVAAGKEPKYSTQQFVVCPWCSPK